MVLLLLLFVPHTALLVIKNTMITPLPRCLYMYFNDFLHSWQDTPAFYVKLEDKDEQGEATQGGDQVASAPGAPAVIGTIQEVQQPKADQEVIDEEAAKRARYPPPPGPPPGLPVALTCPENMTPAKVERYRSIIVNVSIPVSIGSGGLSPVYFKVVLTTLLCFTDGKEQMDFLRDQQLCHKLVPQLVHCA